MNFWTRKYCCPSCGSRFNQPDLEPWPPDVKWYLPQGLKPQCPRCKVFLIDRKKVTISFVEWGVIAIAVLLSSFLPWRLAPQITFFVSYILIGLRAERRAWAAVPIKEERYIVEISDPAFGKRPSNTHLSKSE